MNPKVPGSRNTGSRSTGISSPARCGSMEAAPRNVLARLATKKKRWIFGGSPGADSGPETLAQCGLIAVSILSAISVMVARLYPGGGMMTPKTRFRLPSGRYSSLGRYFQAAVEAAAVTRATRPKARTRLLTTALTKPMAQATKARAKWSIPGSGRR